jgi:hypothetical protein
MVGAAGGDNRRANDNQKTGISKIGKDNEGAKGDLKQAATQFNQSSNEGFAGVAALTLGIAAVVRGVK